MLHIINRSPLSDNALQSCLNTAAGGDILLIEDAVYAATSGNAFEVTLKSAIGRFNIFVLQPDLDARGFGDRLMAGATAVDYAGFVELAASNKTCQSWL
jgi:tRNA 2-thiouridine synthesizing protein B